MIHRHRGHERHVGVIYRDVERILRPSRDERVPGAGVFRPLVCVSTEGARRGAARGWPGVPAGARDVRLRQLVVHGVQVIVHDGDDGLAQVVVVVASRGELRIGGAIFGAVDAECVEQGTAPRAQVLHLGRERREVVTEEVLCVIDERGYVVSGVSHQRG